MFGVGTANVRLAVVESTPSLTFSVAVYVPGEL
jgi:hypothetical protein